MSIVFRIATLLFNWAVALAFTGSLAIATLKITQLAGEATQGGLVSITTLNRQLMGPRRNHVFHRR